MQSGTDMNKTNGGQCHHTGTHGKEQNVNLKKPQTNPHLKVGSSYYLWNSWKFLNF